jgi:hypothetical protein
MYDPRRLGALTPVAGLLVLIVVFNVAYGACPQTQKSKVLCPLGIKQCNQCPMGTACNQCTEDAPTMDFFDCTSNPGQQTQCVDKKDANNKTVVTTCLNSFKCKDQQGGGCVRDTNSPLQPTTAILKDTQNCGPSA